MYKMIISILSAIFALGAFFTAYDNVDRFIIYIGLFALCMCTLAVCESIEKLKR